MSYIGQAPGLGQRVSFRFVATAGQTTFSGNDAQGYPLGYTPGLVDMYVAGRLLSEPDYTAADGSTITIAQALDAGQEVRVLAQAPFSPANTYTMGQADAAFTRRRNRIIDPGMRVSQEQGNSALSLATSGTVYYPSDSIMAVRSGATGAATAQRVALTTPGGSPYRVRFTVTTANAAPAAGDFAQLLTRIEGLDVADLKFGTAAPRTIALRLGVRSSVAGAFAVAVRNGALNRSYIGSVAIAAGEVGADVVKTVILVGDTAGTWATDTGIGLDVSVNLCAGTTFQGVAGWQAGNFLAPASATNLMATANATFDLFDVGLYDVTGLQAGVIPPFELDAYPVDLAKCQRYFSVVAANARFSATGASQVSETPIYFPVPMRINPSASYNGQGGQSGNQTGYPQITIASPIFARFALFSSGAGDIYGVNWGYNLNARL